MGLNNEIARTNNNIPHQFDEVMEMIKIKTLASGERNCTKGGVCP